MTIAAMTGATPGAIAWPRRRVLALAALALVPGAALAQQAPAVLAVSRRRLLNETAYASALVEAERRMTARLQSRIDETKRQLAEEEEELARLRTTLPREEFEARTAAFDRRVRSERREAQRQAAALQNAFRGERVKYLDILDAFLGRLRAERGARLILNADDALAVDPAIDITDDVIAAFDRAVPPPEIPDLDTFLAGVEPEAPPGEATAEPPGELAE